MSDQFDNPGGFADDMAEYLQTFVDETDEQLDDLVETLLTLEQDAGNKEELNEAFRLIHSIKGSAGMMGLDGIKLLTHHLETRFEQFRSGVDRLDKATMSIVLQSVDFLRDCTQRLRQGDPPGTAADLLDRLERLEQQHAADDAERAEDSLVDTSQPASSPLPPPITPEPTRPQPSDDNSDSELDEPRQFWLLVRFRTGLPLADLKARLIVSRLEDVADVLLTQPLIDELAEHTELKEFLVHIRTDTEIEILRARVDVDGVEAIEFHDRKASLADDSDTSPTSTGTDLGQPERLEADEQIESSRLSTSDSPETDLQRPESTAGQSSPYQPSSLSPDANEPLPTAARMPAESSPSIKSETMRVDIGRLDDLMNLAGELVVSRSRFEQISGQVNPELRKTRMLNRIREFSNDLQQLIEAMHADENQRNGNAEKIQQLRDGLKLLHEQSEVWNNGRMCLLQMSEAIDQLARVSHSLQRTVLITRMVPVGPLFSRFKRVVRDLSSAGDKQLSLSIRGEKTELDKRMIDELGDPLMHLVRNAIDHGLESPQERLQAGKSATGTVVLEAFHSGNNVCIEIRDDGRGIDVNRIRERLVERNILSDSEAEQLSDELALDFIWHPGFSTAEQVTDISGRGVGMDVVKTRIAQLNGSIHVQTTPGTGSAFVIRLPLTLAIINSLLVQMNGVTFAIPMDDVQEIVSVQPGDVLTVTGKRHISVRKQLVPFLEIRDLFHWNDDVRQDRHLLAQEFASGKFEVVIIRSAGRTISLRVDSFVGSQDIVIKSLTDNFVKIAGLSGASILGDGSVCLMLDCSAVIGMALDRLAVSNEKTFINAPGSSHEFRQ